MEDPSEEWEVQGHSSSDGSNSKVSWILHKGLNLGKKIVITGVVISSAPLVLLPLVVISALGFAFSIPFGLVFVSYACTEKLMSKLLPGPRYPLMLGSGTPTKGEVEEEETEFGFGDGEYWRKGDEIDDQEPVEEVDDEIDFVKDWGSGLEMNADEYGRKNIEKDDEEPRNGVDEIVNKDGYEKDVGEDVEGKDKGPLEGIELKIEGIREEEKDVSVVERSKWEQPVDVHQVEVVVGKAEKNGDVIKGGVVDRDRADKVKTSNEEEDLARGTTGLLRKVRDEGDVGDPVEKDKWQRKEISDHTAKDMDQKNLNMAAETKKPSEVKGVKLEKLFGKMKGGKKRNKGPKQNKEIRESRTEEHVDAVSGVVEQVEEGIKEDNRDEMKAEKVVVVEEPIGDISKPIKGNTLVNADDRNGASDERSYPTAENPEGHTSEGNAGSLELHVPAEDPKSKHAEIDIIIPVRKVPLSEKKIWERIEALRAIVGYKAEPRATCVEEIKALYIFTGVEPTAASFKNPSDLVEVNDRLQFLMSIVGVK
ncbi:hypothetical protein RHGRI_027194 [Rhododendron griersonianum]|uniref:Uncharacterized protein n=1 Tax=Rhododendron griersonianum TaxID=479676 RepID=A0AAV6J0F5_9ERIC|nr:hypothetical protein RHGRI_027194 [Rhododendron griersonianum]